MTVALSPRSVRSAMASCNGIPQQQRRGSARQPAPTYTMQPDYLSQIVVLGKTARRLTGRHDVRRLTANESTLTSSGGYGPVVRYKRGIAHESLLFRYIIQLLYFFYFHIVKLDS